MKILIGALIGAIIGYITNYIAIKMLFRPLQEKRIFGIKVPFTPGLIPKEKSRIAKNVGEAVGKYLLNRDVLLEYLKGENIKNKFTNYIIRFIDNNKNKSTTIKKLLTKILKDNEQTVENNLKVLINNTVNNTISNDEVINNISSYITDICYDKLSQKPDAINKFLESDNLKDSIDNILKDLNSSSYIQNEISKMILNKKSQILESEMKVSDILPSEVFAAVNLYIFNERDSISNEIKDLIRTPEVADKLKKSIDENVLNKMNPLVSMFLNADSLYSKVLDVVDNYLDDENNKIEIVKYLNSYLDKLKEKQVSEVLNSIPLNVQEEMVNTISSKIVMQISNMNLSEAIIEKVSLKVDTLSSYDELLILFKKDYKDDIKTFIEVKVRELITSENLKHIINEAVDKVVDFIMNKEISGAIFEKTSDTVLCVSTKIYDKIIEKYMPSFLKELNISGIVEEQINGFEVDFAEKIILEIANKELKSITRLGALLGAILGVLSPLINSLF